MANTTENLGLGLDFYGHVPTEQALVENFKKIDAAFDGEGGAGGSSTASAVPVEAIPDTTGDNVQAVLENIAARLKTLEDAA